MPEIWVVPDSEYEKYVRYNETSTHYLNIISKCITPSTDIINDANFDSKISTLLNHCNRYLKQKLNLEDVFRKLEISPSGDRNKPIKVSQKINPYSSDRTWSASFAIRLKYCLNDKETIDKIEGWGLVNTNGSNITVDELRRVSTNIRGKVFNVKKGEQKIQI